MPKPTRLTIWMVLIGTVLVLLGIYFPCVPYISAIYSINRMTGHYSGQMTYFGVYTLHLSGARPAHGDPVSLGTLTGEDVEIPFQIRTSRFIWSTAKDEELQPGLGYNNACYEMFWSLRGERVGKRTIPPDELDAIITRRIPQWNSAELDRDPQAIADRFHAENEELRLLPASPAK